MCQQQCEAVKRCCQGVLYMQLIFNDDKAKLAEKIPCSTTRNVVYFDFLRYYYYSVNVIHLRQNTRYMYIILTVLRRQSWYRTAFAIGEAGMAKCKLQ